MTRKNPVLCILVVPTWENPRRTIKIRQSDFDAILADIAERRARIEATNWGEAYVSDEEYDDYEAVLRYIDRIKEAISAEEQLAHYNYEDPLVARWA